jgi:quinoprotein glucose dehydrogenase
VLAYLGAVCGLGLGFIFLLKNKPMRLLRYSVALLPMFCLLGAAFLPLSPSPDYSSWSVYGGTKDAARYSTLTQIGPDNVAQLQIAWEYHTADATKSSQIQCNPLVIDGVLYGTSPQAKCFALDAATGREIWKFDPFRWFGGENSWAGTSRGVAFWTDGGSDKRILFSAGNYLLCLDAQTGQPVASFGDGGKVDLQKDLDYEKEKFFIVSNTPGVVYQDLLIMGMRLSEALDAPPGHVRAYNIRTGKRAWIFHTIPQPGELGHQTWPPDAWKTNGAANNWAGMSLDEARGIVYVPTGSATYDFWGGNRAGQNLFSDCIVALNAQTGQRLWHYQTVHHDVWDRDLPANPNLVTIRRGGRSIDAVAQITKWGHIFVLDRVTGRPVFPIKEVPVPQSKLAGEKTWPTQPIPSLPEPFMRTNFTEKDILDISPAHQAEILARFQKLNSGHAWLPPSEKGNVLFPGFDGGAEWGGASFDPATGVLYVNANEMPWITQMKSTRSQENTSKGSQLYAAQCANCHGLDRKGNGGAFPNLLNLAQKYTQPEPVATVIKNGRGAMPAFKHVSETNRQALVDFLMNTETQSDKKEAGDDAAPTAPYVMTGYNRFVTKDGYPAIKPPWGTLNAIDLNTGKRLWQVPLGELAELTAKGIAPTGTENYGGPLNTASGLIFIAASKDEYFRAFDKKDGRERWKMKLPAGGYATPATYSVGGKQYVVIACGGGKMGTKSGDSYVAFALP